MTPEQIITWAVGIMMMGVIAAIGHLYHMQRQVQQGLESRIRELSIEISKDRQAAFEARVTLASTIGTLATRQDLREEINRAFSPHGQNRGTRQ